MTSPRMKRTVGTAGVFGVLLGAVYYLWFYDKYDKPKKEPDHDAGADSRN